MSKRASGAGAAVVVLLALGLTACTADEPGPGSGGAAELSPQDPPDGWTAVRQGPLTVHVPAGFEEVDAPPAQSGGPDADTYLLLGPPNEQGRTPGVTTTVVAEATRPVAEEVDAMENLQRATNGVTEFTRAEVDWPGAEEAVYLAYEADVTDAEGASTTFAHEWLYADLEDGTLVFLGAVAPAQDYDSLDMHRVLASVELGG